MRRFSPNIVTCCRLALAFVVLAMLAATDLRGASSQYMDVVLGLFCMAMLTDWLDGYLARRLNAASHLGRILDPFVDKILICGAFILLSGPEWASNGSPLAGDLNYSGVASWMSLVIVGRELLVSMLRAFIEARGSDYSAQFTGKVKLCVQAGVLIVVLFILAHLRSHTWASYVRDTAVLVAVTVTATSVLPYLRSAAVYLRAQT